MEKAVTSLTQRVKHWKELLIKTTESTNLSSDVSWWTILEQTSLTPDKLRQFTIYAARSLGGFNPYEMKYLRSLPWYNQVVTLIHRINNNLADGQQFVEENNNFCCVYHKRALKIFECFIIDPEIARSLKTDILISYLDCGKAACITFVEEIPQEFRVKSFCPQG